MPVFKNKTHGRYVNIYKGILENKSLSIRDRGMLVTLLSFPDSWDFNIAGLAAILPDGKSAIAASIDRLIRMGYLTKEQERTRQGKFGMNVIEVHETPIDLLAEKPSPENRFTDKSSADETATAHPPTENLSQLSNNQFSNHKVIKKESDVLTDRDYKELVDQFGREIVDYQIRKIQEKHYKGCMNRTTIGQWCMEYQKKVRTPKNKFNNFHQREYDWDELEKDLLARPAEGGIDHVSQ